MQDLESFIKSIGITFDSNVFISLNKRYTYNKKKGSLPLQGDSVWNIIPQKTGDIYTVEPLDILFYPPKGISDIKDNWICKPKVSLHTTNFKSKIYSNEFNQGDIVFFFLRMREDKKTHHFYLLTHVYKVLGKTSVNGRYEYSVSDLQQYQQYCQRLVICYDRFNDYSNGGGVPGWSPFLLVYPINLIWKQTSCSLFASQYQEPNPVTCNKATIQKNLMQNLRSQGFVI